MATQSIASGESYVIIDEGRTSDESAFIVVEKGHFAGMGYKPSAEIPREKVSIDFFRDLSRYRENFNIRSMLSKYVLDNPDKVLHLATEYAD